MFSNKSVSGQPTSPPTENGGTPESESVCAVDRSSSQWSGGSTPASSKTCVLYQTVDLFAALNQTPYSLPSTVPTSRAPGA